MTAIQANRNSTIGQMKLGTRYGIDIFHGKGGAIFYFSRDKVKSSGKEPFKYSNTPEWSAKILKIPPFKSQGACAH